MFSSLVFDFFEFSSCLLLEYGGKTENIPFLSPGRGTLTNKGVCISRKNFDFLPKMYVFLKSVFAFGP